VRIAICRTLTSTIGIDNNDGNAMPTLIGLSGSLRTASLNTALLNAAAALMPAGATLTIDTIRGIPLYDGDIESRDGIPPQVAALKSAIATADGLFLVTPEYNNSIPGVFKNAIDWLSRPPKDIPRVFNGRPVALIGASTSLGGTRFSQVAWLPVLRTLGTQPYFGKLLYSASAAQAFDPEGRLIDEKVRSQLTLVMAGFVKFITTGR